MFWNSEIQKHYEAFWDHDMYERAALYLTVRTGNAPLAPPRDYNEKWSSIGYRLKEIERNILNTTYMADGYPMYWVNLGPGILAAMIGSDYHFAKDTVWFGKKQLLRDYTGAASLSLDAQNPANRLVLDITKAFIENSAGRYISGITDLGGTMDILASLRGTETLLMDLIDEPEGVLAAKDVIDTIWEEAFSESYALLKNGNPGGAMSAWIPIWCASRWYPLQCDFSAMLSPDDFRVFVLPSIQRQCRFLDHSIYHLDGPGEIPHLRMLLEIPELDGIQWVPGDGSPNQASDRWFPLYEQIQAAGKNLVLTVEGMPSEEVLYLLKHLRHKGLFISAFFESVEEAREIEAKAVEYARRGDVSR